MKRSTERILTTHTGSLPRPDNLAQLMVTREQGKPIDAIVLAGSVRNAVADVVKHQVIAGIDCGFGIFVGASNVAPSLTWAKLQSLADGARMSSQELW